MQTYTVQKNEHREITITESGEYLVELVGPGAEATIGGTFLAENSDHIDNSPGYSPQSAKYAG